MRRPLLPVVRTRHSGWLVASGLAALITFGCQTPSAPTGAGSDAKPVPLGQLDFGGDHSAVASLDRSIAAAGQDPQRLAPLARDLLAVLQNAKATFAGRQVAAQRLAEFPADLVLAGDSRAAFAAMLVDDQQVNLARLTLDRVPGEAVDALYLETLPRSQGLSRLALVQSAGNRRIAGAVSVLAQLADEADAPLAHAAIKSLGQIGTPEALAALRASRRAPDAAVLEAQLVVARRLGGAESVRICHDLIGASSTPAALRAAAIRELLFLDPASAPDRIVSILAGNDAAVKPVVLEAIASAPGDELVPALGARVGNLDPATQAAVLLALGRRGDIRAIPAVVQATGSAEPTVRFAAIVALGRLPGNPETTVLLAHLAGSDDVEQSKLARDSLARLNGPGVADTVISGCREGETAVRTVFLDQIAARNMSAQLPLLFQMRADPDPAVRSAALLAVGEMAPASSQAEVLAWAIEATDAGEQNRAIRALAAVTLRNSDVAQRAQPITTALEQAPAPVVVRVLPVLQRIGGQMAAECAARIAQRPDPAQAAAAAATLARWTDASGLESLVRVAEALPAGPARTTALQGAVRQLDEARALPSEQLGPIVQRLVAVTDDAGLRSRLVYLLGRTSDPQSRHLAEQWKTDPQLGAAASDALLAIDARRQGAPLASASDNQRAAATILDGKRNTRWGAPAASGQWMQIDFRAARPVKRVVLLNNDYDYPEHLDVFVTDDPNKRGVPVASQPGQPRRNIVELPNAVRGRYLILENTQTREGSWWGISEVQVD